MDNNNNVNGTESFPSLGIVGGQEINTASVSASIAAGFDQLAKEFAKLNEILSNNNIKALPAEVEKPVVEQVEAPFVEEKPVMETPVEAPVEQIDSEEDEKAIFEENLNKVVAELNEQKSATQENNSLENTEDFSKEIDNILKEIKPADAIPAPAPVVEPVVQTAVPTASPIVQQEEPKAEPEKPFSEVNVSTIEQPEVQSDDFVDMKTILGSSTEQKPEEAPVPTLANEPVVEAPAPVAEVKKAYSDVTPLYSGLAIPGTEVKTGDGKHRTYIASDNSKLQVKKSEEKALVMSNAA